MESRTARWALSILLIVLLTSCTPYRARVPENPEGELPGAFTLYGDEQKTRERWWEVFGSPELNALIERAFTGNPPLREFWARLKQARARVVQAGAGISPALTLNAGESRSQQQVDGGSTTPGISQTTTEHTLGLTAQYELDLWGRIRSEREASVLEARATREDLNTAAMTLAAEVAERWIGIISQRMQKDLLQEQLKANLTYLELVELRFQKAMVSALDVYQQRQVVDQVRAQIPLVEAREQLLFHQLAVLLGDPPRSPIRIHQDTLPLLQQIPAPGLPADLLKNRPDILSAGLRLQAAEWDVAAARANRLPAVNLSAGFNYGAEHLDLLFDNWILRLAGTLTAPILDGRSRRAEVDRNRAVAEENLARYRDTVLTAVKEVEDALINESKQQEYIEALRLQTETARRALTEARERYLKGISDYLPVLTQLLSVQGLERGLIQAEAQRISYRIGLYRALGGRWTDDFHYPDPGDLSKERDQEE